MKIVLSKNSEVLVIVLLLVLLFVSKVQGETSWSEDKRFIDNGDMTVTDTKTGLMWMKQDSYLHSGHWINWFESAQYVNTLNKQGFANKFNWRIPTVKELTTIYEANKTNSKVLGKGMVIHIDPIFAKEGSASLWTREENGNYNAFGVVLNTGKIFNSAKKARSRKAVKAVRHLN